MATEKSSHGPTWDDIHTYLQEVMDTHQVHTRLVLVPIHKRGGADWAITLSAYLPLVVGSPTRPPVEVFKTFPNVDHASLEGLVYQLIYTLDYDLGGTTYKQARLWP